MGIICQELGIETGIHLEALIKAARLAERIIGRILSGHVMHSGSLNVFRAGQQMQEVVTRCPERGQGAEYFIFLLNRIHATRRKLWIEYKIRLY